MQKKKSQEIFWIVLFNFFKKGFIYLFISERKEGKEKERETFMSKRNIDWLPLVHPQPGI